MADIGRVALPLIGVVGGFILGGPIGASIGLAIGTGLGYLIFPPEGKTIEGPRLDDLKVTFSSYGKPIPRIYGTMETGGNVVWSPGLEEHRIEEEVGGKGAPSVTSVSFLYTASYRINYSVGPAEAILRNWADGKLIVDRTGIGPWSDLNFAEMLLIGHLGALPSGPGDPAMRDFLGTTTQLPGPAEQAAEGIANTSAYRGTVGQEWEDMALEDYGNRIPQLTAEIAMSATDPFNFTRVTPSTGLLTETAWYSPNPGVVYVGGDQAINRIDFVGNNVLTVPGWATGRVKALDEFDRLWVREGSSNVTFKLYDASTRELLITGTDAWTGVTGGFSSNVRFVMFLENSSLGYVAVSNSGQLAQLVPDLVNLDIDLIRDSADTSPYHLNTWFPGTYDVGTAHQWVLDSNLDPWMTANKGSDGTITRFDRVTGDPVEQIVLTSTVVTRIAYYAADNAFILQNGNNIIKYSLDSMSIIDTLATTIVSGKRNNAIWQVINDKMYIQESLTGNGGVYDISGDTIIRESNFRPNDWVGGVSNMEAYLYDPINDAIIVTGTSGSENDKYLWLYLNRATGDDVTVRSIVEDVSSLVDYTAGTDIDATELTDTLPGYIIRSRMTARKALEPLATAFNFRSVESDFKIKFPKRGGASIDNIPQIDLGATAGEVPTTQPLMKTRLPEDQLFETAIIEYIDPTFDNNPNTQQAKRSKEAIDVGGSLKFDFPGALGNDQAAQIIERILFQAWSGRTNISTAIPLKHILKDPGDVITLTKDGKTVQIELHDVRLGANSIIKIEGTIDDSAVHTSTATGADAEGEEGQVIILTGSTEFFILDINLLRDADEGNGIYVAAGTAEGGSWPGAAIFRGLDTTSIHPFVGITSSRNFDYGFATTVLATFSPDIWDRTNTVTISLTSGTLSSDTEINVLNGANALLIGDEIVQFATAVLNANGTYTISTLLRGRRGTEWASGTHVVNERVIVLSASTLLRVDVDLSDHLSTFFYKAITLGSSQFSSKTIEQVLNLNSQKPYAPSHVAGTRPANDWLFTLIRRTRVGGSWRDFVDAPLSELSENYEWDVMNGSVVERTLTSVVESVTYTEADQITDFGSVQDSVELNVYQVSDTIGRGYVTNVTIGL